jgi:RNA polymerase sigma-70 factor (ECF subfamily)
MNDDPVDDLLSRARAGDPSATRTILDRYEREIRMMVRERLPKKLRNRLDSLDIVQAVWKSFFCDQATKPRQFDNDGHLRAFLKGVAHNKVREQHRRFTMLKKTDVGREESLYVRRGDRDVVRDIVAPDPTPSQNLQACDRLEQLTMGRSPREVEVIKLRREGLTLQEIASKTGVHERTVRRIIEDARSRIR